jgi:hypothetical protein
MADTANPVPTISGAEIARWKALARIILDDRAERHAPLREWLQSVDSLPRSARVALFQSLALHPDNQPFWDLLLRLDTAARRGVMAAMDKYNLRHDLKTRQAKRGMTKENIETAETYLRLRRECGSQAAALERLVRKLTERDKPYAKHFLRDSGRVKGTKGAKAVYDALKDHVKKIVKRYKLRRDQQ